MVPAFYNPSTCGTLFSPNLARAAAEGAADAKRLGIKPVTKNEPNVVLINIDNQVDFTNPTIGKLLVPGADEALKKLNLFIFENLTILSRIINSLDTHSIYQPFFSLNWIAGSNPTIKANGSPYAEGDHPDAFTIITLADVQNNVWLPTRMPNRMIEMLRLLETTKKKNLCIWPFHCLLGTLGHALDPTLMETIFYYAAARRTPYTVLDKGSSPCSEHYGIWKAEVEFPDDPTTALRQDILNLCLDADLIFFAGQARTHCVLETLNQTVELLSQKSTGLLKKMRVIRDCMSDVADIVDANGKVIVPFGKIADARFAEFEKMGIQFAKSTDPVVI